MSHFLDLRRKRRVEVLARKVAKNVDELMPESSIFFMLLLQLKVWQEYGYIAAAGPAPPPLKKKKS